MTKTKGQSHNPAIAVAVQMPNQPQSAGATHRTNRGRQRLTLLGAVALMGAVASPAFAHEMRHLCGALTGLACENQPDTFMFHTGFVNEPAWTGDSNGINLNLSFHPDAAHDKAVLENVDTSKGDVVKLDFANVQYYDNKNGRLYKKAESKVYPTDQNAPNPTTGNVGEKFGTNNVYNIYFKPSKAGIYGFHVKGTLVHTSNFTGSPVQYTQEFDETFICGPLGTKSTDGSKFNCVQDEITFPTDGHKDGKDSDK
jgi:hypothetical protein